MLTLLRSGAILLLVAGAAVARDGDVDPSYGINGTLVTPFYGESFSTAAVAIEGDGSAVLAGYSFDPGIAGYVMRLGRVSPDGAPDPSFAGGNFIAIGCGAGCFARALAVQPNGDIVLAGMGYPPGPFGNNITDESVFALARIHADGTPDTSFGNSGIASAAFPLSSSAIASPYALALQGDGKIVVAGYATVTHYAQPGQPTDLDVAIARFNPDGSLDAGFNQSGTQTLIAPTLFGATNNNELASSVVIDGAGRILVGGNVFNIATANQYMLVARLTPDGSLDASFGENGERTVMVDPDAAIIRDGVSALLVDRRGRIVVAGYGYVDAGGGQQFHFAAVRLAADGAPDPAFGNGGLSVFGSVTGSGAPATIVQQRDGRLVLAGDLGNVTGDGRDFAVLRVLDNGALDQAFGVAGVARIAFKSGNGNVDSSAFAVGLVHDRIVLGGDVEIPALYSSLSQFGTARLIDADLIFDDGFE